MASSHDEQGTRKHQGKSSSRETGKGAPNHAPESAESPQPLQSSRASEQPFCAYLGPAGETCAQTTNLIEVLNIPGPPDLIWMACPQHCEVVLQLLTAALLLPRPAATIPGTVYSSEP